MGISYSRYLAHQREFNADEFQVIGWAFQSEANRVDHESDPNPSQFSFPSSPRSHERPVVRVEALRSSKILQKILGADILDLLDKPFKEPFISFDRFLVVLSLCYKGNTKDKISYLFSMFHASYDATSRTTSFDERTGLAVRDYRYLLQQCAMHHEDCPRVLHTAVDACANIENQIIYKEDFFAWIHQFPHAMHFIARVLQPTTTPRLIHPLQVLIPHDRLQAPPSVDSILNNSPSNIDRPFPQKNSFDFVMEDSEEESEEESEPLDSFCLPQSCLNDDKAMDGEKATETQTSAQPSLVICPSDKQVGKPGLGRKVGKAVGSGLSFVGHGVHMGMATVGKVKVTKALRRNSISHRFDQPPVANDEFVCGYLSKMSDGKWSKKSWHQRWFILEKSTGTISYYRTNPGSTVAMEHAKEVAGPPHKSVASSRLRALSGRRNSVQERDGRKYSCESSLSDYDCKHDEGRRTDGSNDSCATGTKSIGIHRGVKGEHPLFRGSMDLNHANASLLFERKFAGNAPTEYFFQVSTLLIGENEVKRGTQLKLCADTQEDFVLWTNAIAQAIEKKHEGYEDRSLLKTSSPPRSMPRVLHSAAIWHFHGRGINDTAVVGTSSSCSLQQAYRRKLLQEPVSIKAPLSLPAPTAIPGINPTLITPLNDHDASVILLEYTISIRGRNGSILLFFALNALVLIYPYVTVTLPSETQVSVSGILFGVVRCVVATGCFFLFFRRVKRSKNCSSRTVITDEMAQAAQGSPTKAIFFDSIDAHGFKMNSTVQPCSVNEERHIPPDYEKHQWGFGDYRAFFVRCGPNYSIAKNKKISDAPFFTFVGCDLIRSDHKIVKVMEMVQRPSSISQDDYLFVINALIPAYAPSQMLWGEAVENGPSYSLIMYWIIPHAILDKMSQESSLPQLRLLNRFLTSQKGDNIQDRFKVIPSIVNIESCGIRGTFQKRMIQRGNFTPVLTRPQHMIHHTPKYTEVVVDLHRFSYVARQAIYSTVDRFQHMIVDIGFLLQGETDDELPEQLLGCARLVRLNFSKAKNVDDAAYVQNLSRTAQTAKGIESLHHGATTPLQKL